MQSTFKSKFSIALSCFIAGLIVMYGAQKFSFSEPSSTEEKKETKVHVSTSPISRIMKQHKQLKSDLDTFFDDDFFTNNNDPFDEMKKMRERMQKEFEGFYNDDLSGGFFGNWYKNKFGGGEIGEITQNEDDEFIYFHLKGKNLDKNKLKIQVENNQLTITGSIVEERQSKGSKSMHSSSFHRSFPVPDRADPDTVEMEEGKDEIIIKFKKQARKDIPQV